MNYNEVKQHGTLDFPFELYRLYDSSHPRYEMAMHWHSSVELILINEGELYVTLDNRKYVGRRGDMFFVNSETVHGALPKDALYECIVFNPSFLKLGNPACDGFIDDLLHKSVFVNEKIEDEGLQSTVSHLFEVMRSECEGYRFKVLSAIYGVFGEIMEKGLYLASAGVLSGKSEQNVSKLKRAIGYIRDNYDKEITLSDMAEISGLSTKYFCAFFKEMTEKTPVEYLNMYRVEKASRALLGTDMSITEIAYASGFNDLSYFIKTFKSFKNCTPKAYRSK